MIKKLFIFIVLIIPIFGSENKISNIKDIYSNVKETVYLNGQKRQKEYKIEYISSDYLRKEIISPNVNKGEIFQDENGSSKLFIPLFNEISVNTNEDVGNFLSIIKNLKNKDQNDQEFANKYYLEKVKEIKYGDSYMIKIKEYKKINGYLLPIKMQIYEKDIKIAELDLLNTKVNSGLKRKELK
ncbi:MAG: hypothetical protein ACRC4X_07395 [Cetobacterium sp.]